MLKIKKITIKYIPDTDCSFDWLGSFSDEKGPFAVEHQGGIGSYKYFNAENVDNMDQARENYKEMMDYENGIKSLVGVQAVATIYTSQNDACTDWLINSIHSGGCWGFDSEDTETLESEGEMQVEELKRTLSQLGFTDEHFKDVEIVTEK